MKERPPVTLSKASLRDLTALAEMNRQMIADEGYKGKLSLERLEKRFRDWLRSDGCEAVFFLDRQGYRLGYAVYQREEDALFFKKRQVFLRHFFIMRDHRRKGLGSMAFRELQELWKGTERVDLHVLIENQGAVDFWHSLGFKEYQLGMALEP